MRVELKKILLSVLMIFLTNLILYTQSNSTDFYVQKSSKSLNPGIIGNDDEVCEEGLPELLVFIVPPSGGDGSYTYQWWRCTGPDCSNPPVNYVAVFGADNPTYQSPPLSQDTYYVVSVESDGNQDWTNIVMITVHPDPDISIAASAYEVCEGEIVIITATVDGGFGDCIFQWEYTENGIDWNIVGDNSDEITLVATEDIETRQYRAIYACDGEGCNVTISNIITIVVEEVPEWEDITVSPVDICLGGNVDLSASVTGGFGGTITWYVSPAGAGIWTEITSPHSPGLGSWDYQPVFEPIGEGCDIIDDAPINTVTVHEDPSAVISAPETEICEDETLILSSIVSGGAGTCSYQWQFFDGASWINSGDDSDSYTVISTSAFTDYPHRLVYVCDGEGCDAAISNEIDITVFENPTVNAIADPNPQCLADPVDLSVITVGGTAPYNYEWDNGLGAGQNQTVNPLINTTYTVTVTDNNSCSAENSVLVIVNSVPEPTAIASPNPQCAGENVQLSVIVNNGTPPFFYSWDNGLGAGQNHTVNPVVNTTYSVTVTDSNGCTGESSVDVFVTSLPIVNAFASPDIQCAGEEVNLSAVGGGGTGPYFYNWSHGLGAGQNHTVNPVITTTYTVTVVDDNGCSASNNVLVTVNELPTPSATANPSSQCAGEDSDLSASAINGLPPYQYEWNNGLGVGQNHTVNPVITTIYTVTVTDDNGCSSQTSTVLTIYQLPDITATANPQQQCLNEDILLSVTINSGQAPYSFIWDNGLGAGQNHTVSPAVNTTYSVTVTDGNSCTGESSVDVTILELPTVIVIETEPETCGLANGVATAIPADGTPPYSFLWDNGDNSPDGIAENLPAGFIGVTVTDNNGCTIDGGVNITTPDDHILNPIQTSPVSCPGGDDGTAEITIGGGSPAYDLSWDNGTSSGSIIGVGAGTYNITNLSAGTYVVELTDADNCLVTENLIIQEPDDIIIGFNITSALNCFGDSDAVAEITISGGTPNFNINWGNGTVSGSFVGVGNGPHIISGLNSGNYTIDLIDSNGCPESEVFTVNEPTLLEISSLVLINNPSCYGYDDGSVEISILGGTADYDLSWDSGTNSGSLSGLNMGPHIIGNLDVGNYEIIVTDNNSCTTNDFININEPDEISITVNPISDVLCYGSDEGSFEINISGGTPNYNITWDNGTTSGNLINVGVGPHLIENLTAGDYQIEVLDNNSCLSTTVFNITEPDEIIITANMTNPAECFGEESGTAVISVNGGVLNYDISWDNGTSSGNLINVGVGPHAITNLSAGNYTILVEDSNNCPATGSLIISQPTELNLSLSAINASTYGNTDGSATANPSGGTPPYTYEWENAANPGVIISNNQTANNLGQGTYCVTVTDNNNCTITGCIDVFHPPDHVAGNVTQHTHISCFGFDDGIITVDGWGGTTPYDYYWEDDLGNNIGNGPTISGLGPGDYFLTITDALLFEWDTIISIIEPTELVLINISSVDVECYSFATGNAEVTVSGGTPAYTYYWENSSGVYFGNTSLIAGITADSYYVTISDANSCTIEADTEIIEPDELLIISVDANDLLCPYDIDNGWAQVFYSGGTAPFTFTWTDDTMTDLGVNNDIINNLTPGDYNIEITDNNGCPSVNQDFTINIPDSFIFNAIADSITCFGFDDGSIFLNVSGGTGLYTYSWSPNVSSDSFAENLSPGIYNITVTDANLCVSDTTINIYQPDQLIISDTDSNDVSCFGFSDGMVSVTINGGTPPYDYSWENTGGAFGSNNPIQTNIPADTYTVIVYDNNFCGPVSTVLIVNQPDLFDVEINLVSLPLCFGDSNGELSTNLTGGTMPAVSYQWDNPISTYTGANPDNLAAATYSVTVTDSNSCTAEDSYILSQPDELTGILSSVSATGFGASDGSVSVIASDGTPGYTYEWENAANPGVIISTNADVNNLPAGTYCVTITDSNNCTFEDCVVLTEPDELVVIINGYNITCHGLNNGSAAAIVSGGVTPYSYYWENSAGVFLSSSDSISGLSPDTYFVTVTDDNNYTAEASVIIIEPNQIISPIHSISNVTCYSYSNGSVILNVSGGVLPYTITWHEISNPGTILSVNTMLNNVPAGNYVFTLTDGNGCIHDTIITITQPDELLILDVEANDLLCHYDIDNGWATVLYSGGTAPYTFTWTDEFANNLGVNNSTITDLTPGTYNIRIDDINGCPNANQNFIIGSPDPLNLSINIDSVNCFGGNDGSITINVSGGTGDYNYLWFPAVSDTNIASGLTAGSYYVIITDENSCTIDSLMSVGQPAQALTMDITQSEFILCYGENTAELTIDVFGGTPSYILQWSTTGNSGLELINAPNIIIIPDLYAGDYNLTLTDSRGCETEHNIQITEPDELLITGLNTYDLLCSYDLNTGAATVSHIGGTPNYTYSWQDEWSNDLGTDGDSISGLVPGVYSIEITDNNGCSVNIPSFIINIPDEISILAIIDSVSCFGGNDGRIELLLSGGTGDYNYVWNPDISNINIADNLSEGDYYVTITDENLCVSDTMFTVGQPADEILLSIIQTEFILCYGDASAVLSVDLFGGTTPYILEWSNDQMQSDILNFAVEGTYEIADLIAGNYLIQLTDSRGCLTEDSITISQPDDIDYSFDNITEASCFGYTDASVSILASGGTGQLSFLWDDMTIPVTDPDYTNIESGWHYVTITDENFCEKTDSVFIGQPDEIIIHMTDSLFLACFGDSNASTSITLSGGSPDYFAVWFNESYDTITTGLSVDGLSAGFYFISVTDSQDCFSIDTLIVVEPDELTTIMTNINPSCYGYNDGQAWVTAYGGTPPYSYIWPETGSLSDSSFNLPDGLYFVTVTDDNMCQTIDSVLIEQPDSISVVDNTTHVDCDAHMGSSVISVSGGTPVYTYEWSTGDTQPSIFNLPGGFHSVTVTDSNSCTFEYEIEVPVEGSIYVEINQTANILCHGDATAALLASVMGHAPFSYSWAEFPSIDSSAIYNLPAGAYHIIVTDAWNCQGEDIYNVTQPEAISVHFDYGDVQCLGLSNGWARAMVYGGTGVLSLRWTHNNSTSDFVSNLAAGTYEVVVTDANGCEEKASVVIGEPSTGVSGTITSKHLRCYMSNDGQLIAQGMGGAGSYTYQWSGPNGYISFSAHTDDNLAAGIYLLTITDSSNCSYYTQTTLTQPDPIQFTIEHYQGPSCIGNYDGYIVLNEISGGTPPYWVRVSGSGFFWEQQSLFIDSLYADTYRIDVIDANNCVQFTESIIVLLIDANISCLRIPAAFSPNGDGYNDEWQIDNLHLFPKVLVQVYNRWGQLLYEGNKNSPFWDGTYNGNHVPTGAYIYHIDLYESGNPVTGIVTIIR